MMVDIIASELHFASCLSLTLPMHAPAPELLVVVYFAFCAHDPPPASTPAFAGPQVSLL